MTYGTIKVDTVTFTDAGIDKSVTLSGLVQNPTFSGNVTVTGTLSGVTVTGTTANFTSGNFTNISGGTHTITSGVFAAGSAASPSITFTGDLNTGIYSPGADQVAISTGGSGRLFVNADGTITLGSFSATASPTIRSTASPTLSFSDNTNSAYVGLIGAQNRLINFSSGGGTLIQSPADVNVVVTGSNSIIASTANTERLRITSAGLVGIGTSSPAVPLNISSSANGTPATSGTTQTHGSFRIASSNTTGCIDFGPNGSNPWIQATDRTDLSQNYNLLLNPNGGRVGIGTTSPSSLLHTQSSGQNATSFVSTASSTVLNLQCADTGSITINAGGSTTPTKGRLFYSDNSDFWSISTNSAERARIDSSGRLLVGTSTARSNMFAGSISPVTQVEGSSANASISAIISSRNETGGGFLALAHQRSGAVGGNTILQSGDYFGGVSFQGSDGANFVVGAEIAAFVDGTPGANDMPGRLVFSTTADGASSPTERMRIDSSGRVGIGTTTFGAINHILTVAGGYSVLNGLRISGADTANSIYQAGAFGLSSDNYITFGTGGSQTERLRITSAGLVGVGTSALPGSGKLQVAGDNASTSIGSAECLTLLDGNASNEFNILNFATSVGGTIARIGAKATTTGGYPNSVGELHFAVQNGGSTNTALVIDSSSRVGIGTNTVNTTLEVLNSSTPIIRVGDGTRHVQLWGGSSTQNQAVGTATSASFNININSSPVATFDTSGRLLVGTTSARSTATLGTNYQALIEKAGDYAGFSVFGNKANNQGSYFVLGKSRGTTAGAVNTVAADDVLGYIGFEGTDGTSSVRAADIFVAVDGTPGANDMPGRLVFSTTADGGSSPTERLRISNDGVIRRFGSGSAITNVFATNASAGTAVQAITVRYGATNVISGTDSFYVFSNGNVQNTNNSYAAISDIKLKENIVDASSQWNDIKALQVRKYSFKKGQTHTQIGLIAQEVELISPGLVTESPDRDAEGNDLGTVTKSVNYSVLYMKAVKALQEAMERIETLEAKVAALESA